jgi:C-terminal processing protease CtpA/Prc
MLRSGFRCLAAALLVVAGATTSTLEAQNRGDDSVVVARLATLGRIFGAVKYFHPAFLERDVPWDSAMVVAVDRVIASRDEDQFVSVVAELLASLGDPATRVVRGESAAKPATSAPPTHRWEVAGGDSVLVVAIASFDDYRGAGAQLTAALPDARRGTPVVFDLRGPEPAEYGTAAYVFGSHQISTLLPVGPVTTPAIRRRMHNGFAPQIGGTSGGYWSGTYEQAGTAIRPESPNKSRRVVFLVDPWSDVPPVAWALRGTGQGVIVVAGNSTALQGPGLTHEISLTAGARAAIRVGSMTVEPTGDVAVTQGDDGAAPLRAALALARGAMDPPAIAVTEPPAFVPLPEAGYPAMQYPATGYRVLAAYRWWTAINYFFPYKHLIGEPWAATLPRSIRLMLAARDSLEYALAAAEMTTYLRDSHGGHTGSMAFNRYLGWVPVGVQLQYIGGRPVVISVADDSATKSAGIAVGDVILRVDGEDVTARRARLARYVAHSTPQGLDDTIGQMLLGGADPGVARITVGDRNDRVRELSLPRRMDLYELLRYPRTGPVMKVLPGNIGYVDLSLLTVPAVDTMFERFKDTRAIIFDGRGYPQGTAPAIAPRLTDRASVAAAAFRRPLVISPDSSEWSTYEFIQHLPATDKPRYKGRTVMLMDERTISQAEHLGLYLEAANNTTFIGSPTKGANGDITRVVLPGGLVARFTAHDVRHADGRQLQRVGLKPHVFVRPTIAGLRAGRDEVLEKAIEFLRR